MQLEKTADIKENEIAEPDVKLLSVLLKDRSSGRNILWATDNYISRGLSYAPSCPIAIKQISGKFGKVIRPRIDKSKKEQQIRIKDKAEVFTPSWVCNKQNNAADDDWFGRENVFNSEEDSAWITNKDKILFPDGKTWQDYVLSRRLEITCGEAPYLCSRYDTTTGKWIEVGDRIGILDRKIRIVSENTDSERDWVDWVIKAYQSTYGFEWQGDSVLIARENMLYTFIDYYNERFKTDPTKEQLSEIAKIISWNIWQMDGLKYVIPNSCKPIEPVQLSLLNDAATPQPCMGCRNNISSAHTGIYCKIMNWRSKRSIKFIDITGAKNMKFDYVIGNPPYQGDNHQQVYVDFFLAGKDFGNFVDLIFPIGWQEPKNANNLGKLNNPETKADCQIISIDNRQNAFNGVAGAEWTNIVLWKRGYDNELCGKQLVYTNGQNPQETQLLWDKAAIAKPQEIIDLVSLVKHDQLRTMYEFTSSLKPYGLRTDFLDNPSKYNLPDVQSNRINEDDIALYGLKQHKQVICYLPTNYPIPKLTKAFNKYKVFMGKAWGNFSKNYLGGAYADIVVAKPREICTENFLESGCFDDLETAKKHAKYLMTKFTRALLYALKNTQDNSKEKWTTVPVQDFSEPWWDLSIAEINEKLFDKYNVPQNIRSFINNNIQHRTEQNIINF